MPNLLNTFYEYYFWDKQIIPFTLSLLISISKIFFSTQDLSS